jgi:hypothetical protein
VIYFERYQHAVAYCVGILLIVYGLATGHWLTIAAGTVQVSVVSAAVTVGPRRTTPPPSRLA